MNDLPVLVLGLLGIFVGLLVLLSTLGVLTAERQGVGRSLAAIEALRSSPKALREQELERPFAERALDPVVRWLTDLGRRATPADRYERIRRALERAGNPPGWDADRVIGLKVIGLILGAALGVAIPALLGTGALPLLGTFIVLALLGWFAPSLWLYQTAYDRSESIRRDLPDALDLLTISVEAGLAFDAALTQVARKTEGPLSSEFARVLQEMQIGTGRSDAMRALGERTDVQELKSFVSVMVQAEAFGISIADVLRVQAAEMRVKRSQRAEELAQKVPVKILFPLIFCIMPALFVVVIGPAAIGIVRNFSGL